MVYNLELLEKIFNTNVWHNEELLKTKTFSHCLVRPQSFFFNCESDCYKKIIEGTNP